MTDYKNILDELFKTGPIPVEKMQEGIRLAQAHLDALKELQAKVERLDTLLGFLQYSFKTNASISEPAFNELGAFGEFYDDFDFNQKKAFITLLTDHLNLLLKRIENELQG